MTSKPALEEGADAPDFAARILWEISVHDRLSQSHGEADRLSLTLQLLRFVATHREQIASGATSTEIHEKVLVSLVQICHSKTYLSPIALALMYEVMEKNSNILQTLANLIRAKTLEWEWLSLSFYIHYCKDRKLQYRALYIGWSLVCIGAIASQQCIRKPIYSILDGNQSIQFLGPGGVKNREAELVGNQVDSSVRSQTPNEKSRYMMKNFHPVQASENSGCVLEGCISIPPQMSEDTRRRFFLTIKGWTSKPFSLSFLAFQWLDGTDDEGSLWAIPTKFVTQEIRRMGKISPKTPFRYEFFVQLALPSLDNSKGVYLPDHLIHFFLGKSEKGFMVVGDIQWAPEPRSITQQQNIQQQLYSLTHIISSTSPTHDSHVLTNRANFPASGIKAILRFQRAKRGVNASFTSEESSVDDIAESLFDEIEESILAKDAPAPAPEVAVAYECSFELTDECVVDALGIVDVPELPIPYAVSLLHPPH